MLTDYQKLYTDVTQILKDDMGGPLIKRDIVNWTKEIETNFINNKNQKSFEEVKKIEESKDSY